MPLILSTWSFGTIANAAAASSFSSGGSALDAAIAGATAVEDDESVASVGTGGIPDADGEVSLDACVMTAPDRSGAVAYVRRFANPAQIARVVMDKTIHTLLVGEGAERFAAHHGFEPRPILTGDAREQWVRWKSDPRNLDRDRYRGWIPPLNVEHVGIEGKRGVNVERGGGVSFHGKPERAPLAHDTVCVLTRDDAGELAGVCTTSGMAFKTPGRVGDSPIIGHGLYVDPEAGAATATGTGELVSGTCASFLTVELMRQGRPPADAAAEALRRIESTHTIQHDHQVAIVAAQPGPGGAWASVALRGGFKHVVTDAAGTRVEDPTRTLRDD